MSTDTERQGWVLADPVDLVPGSYAGTYKLIGGSLALDFANLVSYRGTSREHDWLVPLGNAERWARAADVPVPAVTERDQLRTFREVIARTFLAIADGGVPAAEDVARIGEVAATAWGERRLLLRDGATVASWTEPTGSLLPAVALDAATVLTSPGTLEQLRACAGCRWLFLDATRNHSRRWCDPADCGNRARQRRHYQRRTQG